MTKKSKKDTECLVILHKKKESSNEVETVIFVLIFKIIMHCYDHFLPDT